MALPSGADPQTEQRAPTLEPTNKERSPTQEPALSKRNVFRPWCPVFALAWLAATVPFLVCSFPGPGPVCFLLLFLAIGRGRHVPAPGGRDVGSNVSAPTQEPVLGTNPRTGSFRLPSGRSMFLEFGSMHQKPRVGGTHGRVRRYGSDGWRSLVPRGDNTGGGRDHLPLPPTIVSSPADRSRTSLWIVEGVRDGRFCAS